MVYSDLLSNIDKNENEILFQKAYKENNSNKMWECVFRCNYNIMKSIYKKRQVIIDNELLLEKTTDATIYVMKFILEKGIKPEKLSSYNYLRCLRFIQNPKDVWYEKNITQMPEDNYKNIDMEIEGEYGY